MAYEYATLIAFSGGVGAAGAEDAPQWAVDLQKSIAELKDEVGHSGMIFGTRLQYYEYR